MLFPLHTHLFMMRILSLVRVALARSILLGSASVQRSLFACLQWTLSKSLPSWRYLQFQTGHSMVTELHYLRSRSSFLMHLFPPSFVQPPRGLAPSLLPHLLVPLGRLCPQNGRNRPHLGRDTARFLFASLVFISRREPICDHLSRLQALGLSQHTTFAPLQYDHDILERALHTLHAHHHFPLSPHLRVAPHLGVWRPVPGLSPLYPRPLMLNLWSSPKMHHRYHSASREPTACRRKYSHILFLLLRSHFSHFPSLLAYFDRYFRP